MDQDNNIKTSIKKFIDIFRYLIGHENVLDVDKLFEIHRPYKISTDDFLEFIDMIRQSMK